MSKKIPRWQFERDEARRKAGLTKVGNTSVVSTEQGRMRANEVDRARKIFHLQTFDLTQENFRLRKFRMDVYNAYRDRDLTKIGQLLDTCGYRPLEGDWEE